MNRYAWEAHAGGRWAALVASGIPFGFGAFSLFVSIFVFVLLYDVADKNPSIGLGDRLLGRSIQSRFCSIR